MNAEYDFTQDLLEQNQQDLAAMEKQTAVEPLPAVERARRRGDTLAGIPVTDEPVPLDPATGVTLEQQQAMEGVTPEDMEGQPSVLRYGGEPVQRFGFQGGTGDGKAADRKSIGKATAEATSRAPAELYAVRALQKDAEIDAISKELDLKAQELGIMANHKEDLSEFLRDNAAETLGKLKGIYDRASQQLGTIQEVVDQARANRINPGEYYANVGGAGTMSSAIAIGVGHLASVMGGGPNTAYDVIKGALDRNMRAQIHNQAHDRSMIYAELNYFDRLHHLGIEAQNIHNVAQASEIAAVQAQLDATAAEYGSQIMRNSIQILNARLAGDMTDALIKSYENVKTTVEMEYFSMAQANAAAKAASLAAQQSAQQQAMLTGLPVDRESVGTLGAGRAGAPGTGRGTRGQPGAGIDMASIRTEDDAINAFVQMQKDRNKPATIEEAAAFAQELMRQNPNVSIDMTAENLENFRVVAAGDTDATVSLPGRGEVRTTQQFRNLDKTEKRMFKTELKRLSEVVNQAQELERVANDIVVTNQALAQTKDRGRIISILNRDPEIQKKIARYEQLENATIKGAMSLANNGKTEAAQGAGELAFFIAGSAKPGGIESLADWIMGRQAAREAGIGAYRERGEQVLNRSMEGYFVPNR